MCENHPCSHLVVIKEIKIKIHDSELRGQEETEIIHETKNTRPLSELFTSLGNPLRNLLTL